MFALRMTVGNVWTWGGVIKVEISELQDKLTGALIGLVRATEGNEHKVSSETNRIVIEGLFATTNMNCDQDFLLSLLAQVEVEKRRLVPRCYGCEKQCGRNDDYDMQKLWVADEDIRALKSLILLGIRDIAAHLHHTKKLNHSDSETNEIFYKALFAIGMDDWGVEDLLPLVIEVGKKI